MTLVGDRQEVRRVMVAEQKPPSGPFNVAVAGLVADWVKASMAKPPVRTLQAPVPAGRVAG